MHLTNLAWMTRNRSLGVSKIPIFMIWPKFLNTSEKMTCFFIVSLADMTFRNSHRPESDFLLPNQIIRPPSLSLQLKRGCFWNFLLENCHTFFFPPQKKYSISNHLVQWTFNSCKSVFSRAQFKKIFHWKKVLEGACKFVFQDRGRRNQPARLGLFAWHFGASFRAGVKPFAFSQWLAANYVKPLI